MVMSVVASVVFGFILLVAVTFAVPDVQGTLDALANAVVYIWTTSLGTGWAEFLLLIAVVAQFFCGTASVTSASRMMFAFSRDRAVPFSRVWRKVSARRVPIYAVAAIGVLAWALDAADPRQRRDRLPRRHLDRRDRPVHRVRDPDLPADPGGRPLRARGVEPRQPLQVDLATGRHLDRVVCILFLLPVSPKGIPGPDFDWSVVNYAPLTVGGAVILFGGWYLLSARKWFTGPVREAGSDERAGTDIEQGMAH